MIGGASSGRKSQLTKRAEGCPRSGRGARAVRAQPPGPVAEPVHQGLQRSLGATGQDLADDHGTVSGDHAPHAGDHRRLGGFGVDLDQADLPLADQLGEDGITSVDHDRPARAPGPEVRVERAGAPRQLEEGLLSDVVRQGDLGDDDPIPGHLGVEGEVGAEPLALQVAGFAGDHQRARRRPPLRRGSRCPRRLPRRPPRQRPPRRHEPREGIGLVLAQPVQLADRAGVVQVERRATGERMVEREAVRRGRTGFPRRKYRRWRGANGRCRDDVTARRPPMTGAHDRSPGRSP